VRTVEEQRHHLLENAPTATVPDTPYSTSVGRALGAILTLDTTTRGLNLVFKSGVKAELDMLLKDSVLMIHERWLDFCASHQKAACWLSRTASVRDIEVGSFS
jgi:hypothetical protein